METKVTKKSWFKNQVAKVQILPWYWKGILSLVIFFLGGSLGTQLFTAADDLMMILGFIILVVGAWFLIQMWIPTTSDENK